MNSGNNPSALDDLATTKTPVTINTAPKDAPFVFMHTFGSPPEVKITKDSPPENKWLGQMEDRITQVLRTGRLTRAFRQDFCLWATYEEANPSRNTSYDDSQMYIKLLTEVYVQIYNSAKMMNDKSEMRQVLIQAWKSYAANQVKGQYGINKFQSR